MIDTSVNLHECQSMGNVFIKLDEICCGREPKIIVLEKKLMEVEELIEGLFVATSCCTNPRQICKK